MSNSTASPLQGDLLLVNQIELVSPTTVGGTLFGIAFSLFCLYVHSLIPRLRSGDRKRQAKFMLAYSSVIMLCGLYNLIFNAWITQEGYIKHSNDPDGVFAYLISTIRRNPVIIIAFACQTVIDVLTSAIQVWRVWVVWSATRYANLVTVLPLLCFLTFSALQMRTVILRSTISEEKASRLDEKTVTTELALQGATTLLSTLLISTFLSFRQWQQTRLTGKTLEGPTRYMTIAAMIVESYVLESIWLLLMAILLKRSFVGFFNESVYYIEIIAYLLVQYRVARGKSYESQRVQRQNISSLRWNHSNHATTQFGATGEIQDGPHVSIIPEASSIPRVSTMA